MVISIRGVAGRDPVRRHVTKRLAAALARLQVKPVGAQALFRDENGPKGGIDVRCTLTVRLPYRPVVRVEHMGDTPRLAFDAAFGILERQLERYVERDRESRRYPKKYFVARRVLGGGSRPPGASEGRAVKGGG